MRRREYVRATGGVVLAGGIAGCGGDGDGGTGGDNEVLVDPNGGNRFDPETLTVDVDATVTWSFERSGHNVSCVPGDYESISLPESAEPFASYDDGNLHEFVDEGGTYSHTFEVAGEYDYVCIPHAASGMQGTVVVEE